MRRAAVKLLAVLSGVLCLACGDDDDEADGTRIDEFIRVSNALQVEQCKCLPPEFECSEFTSPFASATDAELQCLRTEEATHSAEAGSLFDCLIQESTDDTACAKTAACNVDACGTAPRCPEPSEELMDALLSCVGSTTSPQSGTVSSTPVGRGPGVGPPPPVSPVPEPTPAVEPL